MNERHELASAYAEAAKGEKAKISQAFPFPLYKTILKHDEIELISKIF